MAERSDAADCLGANAVIPRGKRIWDETNTLLLRGQSAIIKLSVDSDRTRSLHDPYWWVCYATLGAKDRDSLLRESRLRTPRSLFVEHAAPKMAAVWHLAGGPLTALRDHHYSN